MREIPEFIWQLVEEGIPVELTKTGFKLPGFYKSGEVEVVPCTDSSMAPWKVLQRYSEVDYADCIEDIVAINNSWRQRTEDKQPDSRWTALLAKCGCIKMKIIPAIPAQTIWE